MNIHGVRQIYKTHLHASASFVGQGLAAGVGHVVLIKIQARSPNGGQYDNEYFGVTDERTWRCFEVERGMVQKVNGTGGHFIEYTESRI